MSEMTSGPHSDIISKALKLSSFLFAGSTQAELYIFPPVRPAENISRCFVKAIPYLLLSALFQSHCESVESQLGLGGI
jgi:hypothetical protein